MLVTLDEGPSGAGLFCGGRKKGSSFHRLSAAGSGVGAADGAWGAGLGVLLKNCVKLPSDDAAAGAGDGGAAGGGVWLGGRAGLLKNCVKLPSAEAESETPGDEKPLEDEGPEGGGAGAGRGVSSGSRAGGVWAGGTPETKIRVKSPGPGSAAGCDDPLTTCVFSSESGSFIGGAGAGRCPIE